MATIPIEVIVQDVESPANPTPTPSTNSTEESIAVPDTGAGTIGNSTFSSSSVAGIILPAVLLVLSLATVCTLLIHRHHKRQDSKASKKKKLAAATSVTIVVLAATVLVGNLVLPATKAATSDTEVSIEVPDKISIVVNREDDTTEATTEATAYITSTSAFGYKVLLSMVEGIDTANLYLGGDIDSEYYIAPSEGEELEANTWGYMLPDEEVYSAVPLAEDATFVSKSYDNVVDKETTINYGVKVDNKLPAGTYTGEIEYTTSNAIEYMQDFATLSENDRTTVLASMPEGKQYQLKDIRDEKSYYISRLADGNVWMTQNLDFNIVNGGANLNSANTDVPQDWADAGSLTNTHTNTTWNRTDVTPESYNLGDLYWNGALIYNQETCEANGGTWQPWGVCEDADSTSSTGNSHYHLGNYYNWTAAVAMSDSSAYTTDGQDVNQSICPAGWRLPTYSGDKSYEKLASMQSLITGTDGDIQNDPTYFVYGGYQAAAFQGGGNYGGYWSSVAKSRTFSYLFSFDASGRLNAQDDNSRGHGYLLRCVAR